VRLKILGKCWNVSFVPRLARDVYGDCDPPDGRRKQIRFLKRLRGQHLLEILIHECLHAADWSKDEQWIEQVAADIARAAFRPELRQRIFELPKP
jgi:hypothetical protein